MQMTEGHFITKVKINDKNILLTSRILSEIEWSSLHNLCLFI